MSKNKIKLDRWAFSFALLLLVVSFIISSSVLATTGPIGLWKMDGNGEDSSGNGNNGTVSNVTWVGQGKNGTPGTSAQFLGLDSRIIVPHNEIYSVDSLTIETWLNTGSIYEPGNESSTIILYKGRCGLDMRPEIVRADYNLALTKDYRILSFSSAVFGTISANVNYPMNTWHHIAVTVTKGGLITLYSDGKAVASKQGSPGVTGNTEPISIGNYIGIDGGYPGFYWHHLCGYIDEIALYNRALSAKEIEAKYKGNIVINSATTSADGRRVYVNCTEDLASDTILTYDDVKIIINGVYREPTSWTIKNNVLELYTGSFNTICKGDDVKFTYKASNVVREDGRTVAPVSNFDVINNSTVLPNQAPTVAFNRLQEGQKFYKSLNNLDFGITVTDPDTADKNLETEIYIGIDNVYQKVTNFSHNGTWNNTGTFLAANGAENNIYINKGEYIADNVDDFKLKVVTKDSKGLIGMKELSLVHYQDILARWSLDSVQNALAVDSSGNNSHGVIKDSVLTTGIISNGLSFDGVNSYVSIPSPLLNNRTNWTFEAWVKPEGPGYIYSEGIPQTSLVIEMKDDNSINIGTWHFGRGGNWDWFNTPANVLTRNEWNHIVVTLLNGNFPADSGSISCFVNGESVQQGGRLGYAYNISTKKAAIGRNIGYEAGEPVNAFKGIIDQVTLYECVFSMHEIKQKYEEVIFLDNIKLTNKHNEETSAFCTYGTHLNKMEFDLKKGVSELSLEMELPSNIKLARIENFYKDSVSLGDIAEIDGNKIKINQALEAGHYKIEFLLSIDGELIIKTKSYSNENKVNINNQSGAFNFEFMDFASLPNIT